MPREAANSDAPQTAVLAALQRRLLTMAYAGLLVDHLAFAVSREGEYPPRPGLAQRLEAVQGPARSGARPPRGVIVSVAWHKDTGKWPGYGNPKAQLICELLWRKAGGAPAHLPHGGFDAPGTFATWRKHLVAARRYQPPHSAGVLVAN